MNSESQPQNFSPYIGIITTKNNKKTTETEPFFKIKNTESARNTGADCSAITKAKQLEILNTIYTTAGEANVFTSDNTKDIVGGICIFIEFSFRYFNEEKREKTWFLDYDESQRPNL